MAHSFNPHPVVPAVRIVITIIIVSAAVYLIRDLLGELLLTILIVIWLIGLFYIFLAFLMAKFHRVSLDGNTITYNSGILSIRKIVLPYSRITEASFNQSLLQRIFGVGTLNVDTAGGANMAIHVNDIKHSDLQRILDLINRRSGRGDGT